MFSFSFDDEKNAAAAAENPAPDSGSVSAHTVAQARANAESELRNKPRRPYRKRSDTGTVGAADPTLQAKIDAAIAAQLEGLHDPILWGALLASPADAALAITGREHWAVKSEERATLGAAGSAAARTMMITNPRSLALFMASAAILSVYLPRVMTEIKERRKEKKAETKSDGKTT